MDLQLLDTTLSRHGQPAFRARQVWAWAARGAGSYAEMTDLPAALRDTLGRELPFSSLALERESRARDGTVKALFRTADGHPLEAVMMRFTLRASRAAGRERAPSRPSGGAPRASICLSSQSGCPLTCTFCATGAMRFARNLSASEILDQALHFRRTSHSAATRPTHTVFMGMGEPMLNLDNVLGACERLPDLGIGHRHTTISTVGWIPGIERLAEQDMPLRLALSVHAAEDGLRSQLMPVNERYPLADVIEACRSFYARKRRRVFVEYVMLAGVNDSPQQARALASVLGRDDFKFNLIPYNPTGMYGGSSRDRIAAFRDELARARVPVTIRLTRGRDIEAACGQLAAAPKAPRRAASLTP